MNEENKFTEQGFISDGEGNRISESPEMSTFAQMSAPVRAKKGMAARNTVLLCVLAIMTVTMLLLYILVFKPMLDESQALVGAGTAPMELIDGEVRADDGVSILLYPHIDKAHTQKVTVIDPSPVTNEKFTLVRYDDEDDFYVLEHGKGAPVSAETYLDVIVAAGFTSISDRLTENAEDLSLYGLAEEDYPRMVTIETTGGESYTFYIGALVPTEGGYYCREEGRGAVYIIASEGITPLLSSSESLITPVIGPVIDGTSALMMDSFVLSKNGQPFVSIKFTEINTDRVSKSSYEMIFPARYVVNDDVFGPDVLTPLASAQGYMVVAAGDGTLEGSLYNNEKLMAQYGFYDIDNPSYELFYELGDIQSYIMFTESGSDAYYYAYCMTYDTIVLIEKQTVPFLEWDLLEYVNPRIFFEYIGDVSYLSVSGKLEYQQATHDIDEKISYWFDEDDVMHCRAESTGVTYTQSTEEQNYALAFYMTALNLPIGGYISEYPDFDMTDATEYARLVIGFNDGNTQTYIFYKFGGYCYFTVNGQGDFYLPTNTINRLLVNAVRVANNAKVDIQQEYPTLPDIYLDKIEK